MDNKKIMLDLDIDYNKYKESLIKGIIKELDNVFNIFDDENNTSIIMLFIINIKIIKNEDKYKIDILKDLIESLKNITNKNIDQKEYLEIILKILNLSIIIEEFEELILTSKVEININKFMKNLKELFEEMKENNTLIGLLFNIVKIQKDVLILLENKNEESEFEIQKMNKKINEIIINISRMLAKDYFIYYNSKEMLEYLYNNTRIENNNYVPYTLLKHNETFQNTYLLNSNKYITSYENEKNKIAKYKYNIKNDKFKNLLDEMENLQYV
jgi:hypothetical protein